MSDEIIRLSKNNLQQWKTLLDKQAVEYYGPNYSSCLSDEECLELYIDMTPMEAILEDDSYSM